MPYIKGDRRAVLHEKYLHHSTEDAKNNAYPVSCGELNFVITKLCLQYMMTPSYSRLNEIIGVLECVKQEFYRRAAAPYEDKKIQENGDVY